MSGTGVTYYDEELKHLFRLLKALPDDIPSGNAHDFIGYIPDPEEAKDFGSVQSVVSHSLEVSFGSRRTSAGEDVVIQFKSRGPPLEEVVSVLRHHITGRAGTNVILVGWVDSLTAAAVEAIEKAGQPLPRPIKTSVAKRLLEDKAVEEQARKKQKKDEKARKQAEKEQTATAKKKTEQGAVRAAIDANMFFATFADVSRLSDLVEASVLSRAGPARNPGSFRLYLSPRTFHFALVGPRGSVWGDRTGGLFFGDRHVRASGRALGEPNRRAEGPPPRARRGNPHASLR
ncbi:hypothetical protein B0H14DRAFT_3496984 [Mycena olivaceomarginata]|nr:hypothetical protein B0H14DRAFT_3496984 [Mycena olivaceomarginata]